MRTLREQHPTPLFSHPLQYLQNVGHASSHRHVSICKQFQSTLQRSSCSPPQHHASVCLTSSHSRPQQLPSMTFSTLSCFFTVECAPVTSLESILRSITFCCKRRTYSLQRRPHKLVPKNISSINTLQLLNNHG